MSDRDYRRDVVGKFAPSVPVEKGPRRSESRRVAPPAARTDVTSQIANVQNPPQGAPANPQGIVRVTPEPSGGTRVVSGQGIRSLPRDTPRQRVLR